MSGRYALTVTAAQLQDAFPELTFPEALLPRLVARYNIAPTANVPVVTNEGGKTVEFMRWGLIPHWAEDPKKIKETHNTRAETAASKPTFREPFRSRRCLLLADSYYLWAAFNDAGRTRAFIFRIMMKTGEPFAFAGLWDEWRSPQGEVTRSASMLTTVGNQMILGLNPHYRMPVILKRSDHALWLDPLPKTPQELAPLLTPYPAEHMTMYPVTDLVNSAANDHSAVIEPRPKDKNPFAQ